MSSRKDVRAPGPHLRLINGGAEGDYKRPSRPGSAVFETHVAVEIRLWHKQESLESPTPIEPVAIPALLAYSQGGVPVVSLEDADGRVECEPLELKEAGYDCIVVLEDPTGEQEELLQEASFWGYVIEPRVGGRAWRDIW